MPDSFSRKSFIIQAYDSFIPTCSWHSKIIPVVQCRHQTLPEQDPHCSKTIEEEDNPTKIANLSSMEFTFQGLIADSKNLQMLQEDINSLDELELATKHKNVLLQCFHYHSLDSLTNTTLMVQQLTIQTRVNAAVLLSAQFSIGQVITATFAARPTDHSI